MVSLVRFCKASWVYELISCAYLLAAPGYGIYKAVHRLYLWPRFLSPLKNVPGPPLGNIFVGQSPTIIKNETGIPQREWVKQYGPVVRIVGPVGIERLIFMKPEALHQILVKDWLDYPRVSASISNATTR